MKYKEKVLGIYLPVFAAVLIISTILRTVALFIDYNEKTGYFGKGIISSVSGAIVFFGAVFFLTYIISRAGKGIKLLPSFTNTATYISAGIAGVAFVFGAVFFFFLFINEAKITKEILDASHSFSRVSPTRYIIRTLFYLALSVLGALSATSFGITALSESRTSSRRASLGLATVVFLSLYAAYLFFSDKLPLNAPNKAIDQITALLLSLFFLYEVRISLGRERWRGYIAFGLIAAMLSAYSSIPSLIIYLAKGIIISDNIYETLLTFALFIYVTARVILTSFLTEKKESTVVTTLKESASERARTLEPEEKAQPEEEEHEEGSVLKTQISIDISAPQKESPEEEIPDESSESESCSSEKAENRE